MSVMKNSYYDMMTKEDSHCMVTAQYTCIAAKDMLTTIEELLEAMSSIWSMTRLYNEDNWTSW
jgi:hypothetical protein